MWFGVVTALPQLIEAGLQDGVVGRATSTSTLDVEVFSVRDHALDRYGSVDDHPFGGAPGMLMMAEPLAACTDVAIQNAPKPQPLMVYLSPQGEKLDQSMVRDFAAEEAIVLICGRYEGVDERYIDAYVDREISVGDYVLSGGELPALVLIDAVGRLLEGTLGNRNSATDDSFGDNLLEGPQFTRPREWRGMHVPTVLTSGHHAEIEQWRREQALLRTWQRRPDLLAKRQFDKRDKTWLDRHVNKQQ